MSEWEGQEDPMGGGRLLHSGETTLGKETASQDGEEMWRPWVEFNHNSSLFLFTRNERTGLTGRPVHPRRSLVNCLFYQVRSEGLALSEWCARTSRPHSDLWHFSSQ